MFKRIFKIMPAACLAACLATCLTAGAAWAAQSPFIGEWKLDPSKSRLPDEMKVESQGGARYAFDFGAGPETIVVDGTDQPGYGDTLLSVRAEAPDTWIVERKTGGRLQLRATWKLARDGRTLTDYFRGFDADGPALSMDYVYQREGAGSGFAGDWRSIKETMNSPYSMQVKAYKGDGLSFVTPAQRSTRNVIPDGKEHVEDGSNRGASSLARLVDARTLVVIDKTAGKVSDTREIALSADLKTLTMTVRVPGRDRPTVLVFERST